MVEKKLMCNTSYEEVCSHIEYKGWNNTQVADRCFWYRTNNKEGKYDQMICWLYQYLKGNNKKTKITPEQALYYKELYGVTESVVRIKEDLGVSITRQGLYAALKRGS